MASKAVFAPILAFVAVFTIAYWAGSTRSVEAEVTRCVGRCFCLPDVSYLRDVLDDLVQGTKYQGKYQINGLPRADELNVYFVCKALSLSLRELRDGCFYLHSSTAIIVCDLSFIDKYYEYFAAAASADNPGFLRSLDSFAKPLMLKWFLGHELGHAVRHPNSAHFGFDGRQVRCSDLRFNRRREFEADAFVVEQGLKESVGHGESRIEAIGLYGFTAVLWAIVEKEADRYEEGSQENNPEQTPFRFRTNTLTIQDTSCSHPPRIIRAISLLDAITAKVELAKDQRHMLAETRRRIIYLGEKSMPQP